MSFYRKIGVIYSNSVSHDFVNSFISRNDCIDLSRCGVCGIDVLVVLGGDGLLLHSLHEYVVNSEIPAYGINCGTVGFLLNNNHDGSNLVDRLIKAVPTKLPLLDMNAVDLDGNFHSAVAINEVSLFRGTHQALHLRVSVDGKVRMEQLISDGIMLSTPAGSTAYNFSAGGSILPLCANVLALTSINSFRPRRWCGALLKSDAQVKIEVLNPGNRKASVVADYTSFENIASVTIRRDLQKSITLLFDSEYDLAEKIIAEQFLPDNTDRYE